MSFLVYSNVISKIAKGLSTNCFISVDRGLERWQWMMDGAVPMIAAGVYRIDLNTLPPNKSKTNDANRAWNLRTLLLLNRAGIIQLESERPPDIQKADDETAEQLEKQALRRLRSNITSQVLFGSWRIHIGILRRGNVWWSHFERPRTFATIATSPMSVTY